MSDTLDQEILAALAARCGIVPGYHDIWGHYHATPPSTQVALLRAMRVDVARNEAMAGALEARSPVETLTDPVQQMLARLAFEQVLAPVQIAFAHEPTTIFFSLAQSASGRTLRWSLKEEGGAQQFGELQTHALERVGMRTVNGEQRLCLRFELPETPEPGYHRFSLEYEAGEGPATEMSLIVTPPACYRPPALGSGRRVWGLSLQLYGLRSNRNWGIGDFGDLIDAIDLLGELGAATIGLNPLHALDPAAPEHASPYSPSSRLFLNPLYIAIELVQDYQEADAFREFVAEPAFQLRLEQLRAAELVAYTDVTTLKLDALRKLYEHFQSQHLQNDGDRAAAFRRYQADGGEALWLHALFESLRLYFGRTGQAVADLPVAFRDPGSAEVVAFRREHAREIEFHQYLQWQAALQLERAAERAARRGLYLGLYGDLALGSDGNGADVWANDRFHARGANIGAPPDDFSPNGQDWALPPLLPEALWACGFRPFIAALRASMQHAGALRIDHVMGLCRLFWVPAGGSPGDGAYVSYPFRELLGIVALESERNRCLVIGEDLGTVPDEVRAALYDYGVLSYRVLYFEKRWHADCSFRQPAEYPEQALVTAATHDLPTLAGFWLARDLESRRDLGLFDDQESFERALEARAPDRARLLDALGKQGLALGSEPDGGPPDGLAAAVHSFLARTPAWLLMIQIEDVLGQTEQANLPGTHLEHSNWRRKLPLTIEAWRECPALVQLAASLDGTRGARPAA